VDTAEALAALRDLGCEIAQGFYIARPMRADLLPEWARAYSSATTAAADTDTEQHGKAANAEA
jgi:predicted signal transduction protein with EAL and GGDEF domain